jgi:hypothetical protein
MTGWAIAGAVVLLLFGLLFFSMGRDTHQNPPNTVTQSQPQK